MNTLSSLSIFLYKMLHLKRRIADINIFDILVINSKNMKEVIFFYDGDCGFCNTTVLFLLEKTKMTSLLFCPLQSKYAENFFAKHQYKQPDLTTAYLFYNDCIYQKSSAILKAITLANGPIKHLGISLLIPSFFRDSIYDFISSVRKYIQLDKNSCRVLTPEESKRFLLEIN